MEVGSVLFALAFAAFAYWRSFATSGYYDAEVYAMTPATHRKYAGIGLCLAAIIWAFFHLNQTVALVLDAALAIVAVFYLSSFLRGAQEEQ